LNDGDVACGFSWRRRKPKSVGRTHDEDSLVAGEVKATGAWALALASVGLLVAVRAAVRLALWVYVAVRQSDPSGPWCMPSTSALRSVDVDSIPYGWIC
jgi:hypothetical protein